MASQDRSTSETRELPSVRSTLRWMACFVALLPPLAGAADDEAEELWVLKPVVRPEVSAGRTASSNPIDAFIAAEYEAEGLKPVGPADKRTLLRRVYLDLIGLPPTPAEQEAFLRDESPDAYEKVVDRLLGQRAARRPLRPALARRPALRRRRRADDRRARHPPLARLGDPRPQRRPALRPVRPGAADRLPVHRAHPDVGHRRPLARRAAARRPVRARLPRPRGRPPRRQGRAGAADRRRRDGLHRLHGPDRRLRQVPRPHVRPDQAARLLRHEGAVRSARAAGR